MMNIYDGVVELEQQRRSLGGPSRVVRGPQQGLPLSAHRNRGAGTESVHRQQGCRQPVQDRGGAPGMEVSWQVTGIRKDAYANAHRIPVEEQKNAGEKGHYLHPELFGTAGGKASGMGTSSGDDAGDEGEKGASEATRK